MLGRLRLRTLLFVELCLYALSTPFFPGCGYRQTFVLPRDACRLCGLLCGTMGLKQSRFSIGSSATAIGEIIVFGLSHVLFRWERRRSESCLLPLV